MQAKVEVNDIHIFHWKDIKLQPGKNVIEVTGKSDTQQLTDSCEWVLEQ